jgi:hypothetical protein
MTQSAGGPAADPAFAILLEWYRGELGGEMLFAGLAAAAADPACAAKWNVLAELEHATGQRLAEAIVASGGRSLSAAGDQAHDAVARIDSLRGLGWPQLMTWLHGIAVDALESMTAEARSLPPQFASLVECVLAHERALVEFADRELAGDEPNALAAVRVLLEGTH